MNWRDVLLKPRAEAPRSPASVPTAPSATHDVPIRDPVADLQPGARIAWRSPLFGTLQGVVSLPPERGKVCVSVHPITGDPAFIPVDWIVGLEPERDTSSEGGL